MNETIKLSDNIKLEFVETIKIGDSVFYKYKVTTADGKTYDIYFLEKVDTKKISKKKLANYIEKQISENSDNAIVINNNDFLKTEEKEEKVVKKKSGDGALNFTNYKKFDDAMALINELDTKCDLQGAFNELNYDGLSNSNKKIAQGLDSLSLKLNKLQDNGGPSKLISDYQQTYKDLFEAILSAFVADQKLKAENGELTLSADSLKVFGSNDVLNKDIYDYCSAILDDGKMPSSFTEYFSGIEQIYNKYDVISQDEALDILNANKLTTDSDIFNGMTEEEKDQYLKNLNLQLDGIYDCLKDSLGLTREQFDDLVANDTESLAKLISDSSIASATSVANGGESSSYLNDFFFAMQDAYYSTEAGQQALLNNFLENSPTEYDEYNALGYTDYIQYCMATGHAHDWLREDLRSFSNTIDKINLNSNMSGLKSDLEKEELDYIQQCLDTYGYLPYGYVNINGTYQRRTYTTLGQEMLYYMDYHCGENVWNYGDNKVITAFSDQGKIDAIQRNHKGQWIYDRTKDAKNDEERKTLEEQALRDYQILNGIITDKERKEELINQGYMSFSDLLNFIKEMGDDVTKLSSEEYIKENEAKILEASGLSESQLYNFKVNTLAILFPKVREVATATVTLIELTSGLVKFFENLGDAVDTAIHSDFFIDFANWSNTSEELQELRLQMWNEYILNSELYNEDFEAYLNGAAEQDFLSYFSLNRDDDAKYTTFEGIDGIYRLPSDVPEDVKFSIIKTLFQQHKYQEWDLKDISSSNYYTGTFKAGIRNGGVFTTFDSLSQNIIENAQKQIDTMNRVAEDKTGNWFYTNVFDQALFKFIEANSLVKNSNILGMTANQIGNMAIPVAASLIPGIGQGLSSALLFTSSFGGASEEAFSSGASYNEALGYATLSATTELLIEHVFSGIEGFGEGWLDNVLEFLPNKLLSATGLVDNVPAQVIKKLIVGGIGEGVEEVATDFVTPLWKSLTFMNEKSFYEILSEDFTWENEIQTFLVSFLSSMVFGSGEIIQKKNLFNKQYSNLVEQVGNIPGMKEAANSILAEIIGYDANVLTSDIISKLMEKTIVDLKQSMGEDGAKMLYELGKAKQELETRKVTFEINNEQVTIPLGFAMDTLDMAGLTSKYSIEGDTVILEGKDVKSYAKALYNIALNQLSDSQVSNALNLETLAKELNTKTFTKEAFAVALEVLSENNIDISSYSDLLLNEENISVDEQVENIYRQAIELIEKNGLQTKADIDTIKNAIKNGKFDAWDIISKATNGNITFNGVVIDVEYSEVADTGNLEIDTNIRESADAKVDVSEDVDVNTDANTTGNTDTTSSKVDIRESVDTNVDTDTTGNTDTASSKVDIRESVDTNVDTDINTETNTDTDTNIETQTNIKENVSTSVDTANAATIGVAAVENARTTSQNIANNTVNVAQEVKVDTETKKTTTESVDTNTGTKHVEKTQSQSAVDTSSIVVKSQADLISKYGDDAVSSFSRYVFDPNSVYGLIANNDLEQLELIKNMATDCLGFADPKWKIYDPCKNVVQMIDFAVDGGLGTSVSNVMVNGKIIVDLNVAKEFIAATNGNVSLSQIFNLVRSNSGDCNLLFANDTVISTCETFLEITNNNGFSNQYTNTLRQALDIAKSSVDINEKYLLVSKMRLETVKPTGYDIFESSIAKNGIDVAISELAQSGISATEVVDNILFSAIDNTTPQITREYYYKAFDYLISNNVDVKTAVDYVVGHLNAYYDIIGSRVIYSDASGLKISVACNYCQGNLDSVFNTIMESFKTIRKDLGNTDLNHVIISDRMCPNDLYVEKILYKDYVGNSRFIAAAYATNDTISIWNGQVDVGNFYHEYGHTIEHYITRTFGLSERFAESSEWASAIEADKSITSSPISDYATASVREDFAEFIRIYEQDPIFAVTRYPNRFNVVSKYLNLNLEEKVKEIGAVDLFEMFKQDTYISNSGRVSYEQINNALLDIIEGREPAGIFSETQQKLLEIFSKDALTDVYEFNKSYEEFIDYINGNTSYIHPDTIESMRKNISHIPEFFREKIELISDSSNGTVVNMFEYLNGTSEPIIIPRTIDGAVSLSDVIYKTLHGDLVGRNLVFSDVAVDLKAFSNYVVSNNIVLDEMTMKKINVIESLGSNDVILNISEFLSGKDAIIANSIQVDGNNVSINTILDVLKGTGDNYLKILQNETVDGLNRDNIIKAIDELYSVMPSLKERTDTNYQVLKYHLENGSVFAGSYVVPKTIVGIDIDTSLIESILSNPESILNYSDIKQLEIIKSIDELMKYFEQNSNNFEESFRTEYMHKFNELQQLMLREKSTLDLGKGVYSDAYQMFKSLKGFGADQGVINKMIEKSGITKTIQILFDNVGSDTFLKDVRELGITDDMMFSAIDEAVDIHDSVSFISNYIFKVFSINPDTKSINNLVNFLNNNDVVNLIRKNYPGMSKVDAIRFLYLMETSEAGRNGICNYATAANMIFEHFNGKEQLFEQSFGYPMYITLENGKRILNDRMLLADMYSIINDGVLVKNINGSYEIDITNEKYIDLSGRNNITEGALKFFFEGKGLNIDVNETFTFNSYYMVPNMKSIYKDKILSEIKKCLESGQNVNIVANGFNLYNSLGIANTKDCSGHIMTILGINSKGQLIVDSWGKELLINFDEMIDNVCKPRSESAFIISSYETTNNNASLISPGSLFEGQLGSITSFDDLKVKYGEQAVYDYCVDIQSHTFIENIFTNYSLEELEQLRSFAKDYISFANPEWTLYDDCKMVSQLVEYAIEGNLGANVKNIVVNGEIILDINSAKEFIRVTNGEVSLQEVFDMFSSKDGNYPILRANEKVISSCETLVKIAKDNNLNNQQISKLEKVLEVVKSDVDIVQKYKEISKICLEEVKPEYFDVFEANVDKRGINYAIKALKKAGVQVETIADNVLYSSITDTSSTNFKKYYYKAYDLLEKSNGDASKSAIYIQQKLQLYYDTVGSRVVYVDPSGVEIRVVNNYGKNNLGQLAIKVIESYDSAKKKFGITDLQKIVISDRLSPDDIYFEKVAYKDYCKKIKAHFVSAATANDVSINVWNGTLDDSFTISHEYGHTIEHYITRTYGLSERFSESSEWVNAIEADKAITSKPITGYATSALAEDFAEFIAEYHRNPEKIAAQYPNRYKVLSKYIDLDSNNGSISNLNNLYETNTDVRRASPVINENIKDARTSQPNIREDIDIGADTRVDLRENIDTNVDIDTNIRENVDTNISEIIDISDTRINLRENIDTNIDADTIVDISTNIRGNVDSSGAKVNTRKNINTNVETTIDTANNVAMGTTIADTTRTNSDVSIASPEALPNLKKLSQLKGEEKTKVLRKIQQTIEYVKGNIKGDLSNYDKKVAFIPRDVPAINIENGVYSDGYHAFKSLELFGADQGAVREMLKRNGTTKSIQMLFDNVGDVTFLEDFRDANITVDIWKSALDKVYSGSQDTTHITNLLSFLQNNDVINLVRKNYPGMSKVDAIRFLYLMESSEVMQAGGRGICSYGAVANMIFEYFVGKEELFEHSFGYPMYLTSPDGRKIFNDRMLIADMYSIINDGVLVKNMNSSYEIEISNKFYKNLSALGKVDTKTLDVFLKKKDLNIDLKETLIYDSDEDIMYKEEVLLNIQKGLESNQYIFISGQGFNLYKTDGNLGLKDCEGHIMSILGINPDGKLIVSSWGREVLMDLEELIGNEGSKYGLNNHRRYFVISSYEIIDTDVGKASSLDASPSQININERTDTRRNVEANVDTGTNIRENVDSSSVRANTKENIDTTIDTANNVAMGTTVVETTRTNSDVSIASPDALPNLKKTPKLEGEVKADTEEKNVQKMQDSGAIGDSSIIVKSAEDLKIKYGAQALSEFNGFAQNSFRISWLIESNNFEQIELFRNIATDYLGFLDPNSQLYEKCNDAMHAIDFAIDKGLGKYVRNVVIDRKVIDDLNVAKEFIAATDGKAYLSQLVDMVSITGDSTLILTDDTAFRNCQTFIEIADKNGFSTEYTKALKRVLEIAKSDVDINEKYLLVSKMRLESVKPIGYDSFKLSFEKNGINAATSELVQTGISTTKVANNILYLAVDNNSPQLTRKYYYKAFEYLVSNNVNGEEAACYLRGQLKLYYDAIGYRVVNTTSSGVSINVALNYSINNLDNIISIVLENIELAKKVFGDSSLSTIFISDRINPDDLYNRRLMYEDYIEKGIVDEMYISSAACCANGTMYIWNGDTESSTIIHEYGHSLDEFITYTHGFSEGFSESSEWANAVEADKAVTSKPISAYASTALVEDFAEFIAEYQRNPRKIAAQYPNRYNVLSKYIDLDSNNAAISNSNNLYEANTDVRRASEEISEDIKDDNSSQSDINENVDTDTSVETIDLSAIDLFGDQFSQPNISENIDTNARVDLKDLSAIDLFDIIKNDTYIRNKGRVSFEQINNALLDIIKGKESTGILSESECKLLEALGKEALTDVYEFSRSYEEFIDYINGDTSHISPDAIETLRKNNFYVSNDINTSGMRVKPRENTGTNIRENVDTSSVRVNTKENVDTTIDTANNVAMGTTIVETTRTNSDVSIASPEAFPNLKKLSKLNKEEKTNVLNKIKETIKGAKKSKNEYLSDYDRKVASIPREKPVINIENGVYSETYHMFKSLEVFGAEQGAVRGMIDFNGTTKSIQMLFDNVGNDTFLRDLRDIHITDDMMFSAIDKVISINQDTELVNKFINFINNNDIIKLVQKNYPGMSKIEALRFMYLMETKESGLIGICSYATVANMIFEYFKGNEQLFEQTLGYPMYITLNNGKKILNDEMLLTDMYSIINDGVLAKKVNGAYEIEISGMNRVPLIPSSKKIDINALDLFLRKKGLNIGLKETFSFNSESDLMFKEEVLLKIKECLESDQYITLSAKGFTLYELDGNVFVTDCESHVVTVLGINPDGKLIVSSWGSELLVDLEELIGNGSSYTVFGQDKWFDITSYELTDSPLTTPKPLVKEQSNTINSLDDLYNKYQNMTMYYSYCYDVAHSNSTAELLTKYSIEELERIRHFAKDYVSLGLEFTGTHHDCIRTIELIDNILKTNEIGAVSIPLEIDGVATDKILDFMIRDTDSIRNALFDKNGSVDSDITKIVKLYNYYKSNSINLDINPNLEQFIIKYNNVVQNPNNILFNIENAFYNGEDIVSLPTMFANIRYIKSKDAIDIIEGKKSISSVYYSEIDLSHVLKEIEKYFEGKNVTLSENVKKAFNIISNLDENMTICNLIDAINGKRPVILPNTINGEWTSSSIQDVMKYLNGENTVIFSGVIENLKKVIDENGLYIPSDLKTKIDLIANLGDNIILNEMEYLKGISDAIIFPKYIKGTYTDPAKIYGWLLGTETIEYRSLRDVSSDIKAFTDYVISSNITLDEIVMKKLNVIQSLNTNEVILNLNEFLMGKDAIIANNIEIDGTVININAVIDLVRLNNDVHLEILGNKIIDGLKRNNLFEAIDELYKIMPSLREETSENYKLIKEIFDNNYVLNNLYIIPKQFGNIDSSLIDAILSNPNKLFKYNENERIDILNAINEFMTYIKDNVSSTYQKNQFIDKYNKLMELISREIPTINIENGVYSDAYHMFKSLEIFDADQGVIRGMLKTNGIKESIQMLFDNVGNDTFLRDLRDTNITKDSLSSALDRVFLLNKGTKSISDLISFISNNNVVNLIRKNYPGMNGIDAIRFMYLMETKEAGGNGICNYASAANMIFEYFLGKEELFEQSLGYPMYITLENGKRVLNDKMLLADMYSIINDGVLVKKVNGSYEIDITNNNYVYLSNEGRLTTDALDKFLKRKGLEINLKETFFFDSDENLMHKEEILSEVKKSLESNQYVTISAGGFNLYNLDGSIAKEDCSGHIMTILGINPDGKIIVDSWGRELLIDLEELIDNLGSTYGKDNFHRWFYVVSYEFTDTPTDINISPNSNTNIHENSLNSDSTPNKVLSQRELEEMYGRKYIDLFREIYNDTSKLYTYISTLDKSDVDLMRRIVDEYYNSSPNETLEKLRKDLSSDRIDLRIKYDRLNNTPYTFESLSNIIDSSNIYTYVTDKSFVEGSKLLIEYHKEMRYDTSTLEKIVSVLDSDISLDEKYTSISQIRIESITPKIYYEYQNLFNIHKNVSEVITILEERGYNSVDISSALLHSALRNTDKDISRSYYNKAFDYLVNKGNSKESAAKIVQTYYEYLLNERGVHTVLTTESGIEIKIVNGFNCDNKLLNPQEIVKVLEKAKKFYTTTDLKEIIIYDTFSPKNKYSENVQYKNYSKNKAFISAASATSTSISLWSDFDDINTLVHEYAHTIDRHISRMYAYPNYFSNSKAWIDAIKEDKIFNDRIISRYATASNQEDFAEFLRVFHKDPLNTAMSYPNRYKIASRYLNLELENSLIEEYIQDSPILYVIDDAIGILSKDGTPLAFIKDYLNNTPYNSFAKRVFDELNIMYENKLEIFEDFTTYQVLDSIKLETSASSREFINIIKEYLNNKDISDRISIDNKKILDLMNKSEIREWIENEEFDITEEVEPIIIDEHEYQETKTNDSVASFFRKDNDIDRLEKIFKEDISLLDQSDLEKIVDYINKGKIKIKDINLSMETINTLLSNGVKLNKIYPLSNIKAIKTFIDYFSLDTLTLFDKLNNGFLLMNNADNLYQLYDYYDLSIPVLEGTTKMDELYNLITNTINSNKTSELRSYTFNYQVLENTEYSKLHPELFLDKNAPSNLKELYYTGKINSGNEYNSEFSKYLDGKSVKGIIHKPLQELDLSIIKDINLRSSNSTKYLSGLEELSKKIGLNKEEIQSVLNSKLQDLINNSEFVVRRSANSLLQILQSGKIKNQFEVNNSTFGVYNPNMRMTMEEEMFNLPRNIRYEERPIYGMLLPKDLKTKYVLKGPGTFYSSNNGALFVFDIEKIKQSTTLTLADSLDYASKINATNITEPKYYGMMDELLTKINSKEDLYNFDFTQLYSKSSLEVGTSAYYEFQVHGNSSHSLDNLKKIVFLKNPSEKIIKELKKLNINWEVL